MSAPSFTVLCPSCESQLSVLESARGKQVPCPRCKKLMKLPAARSVMPPQNPSPRQAIQPANKPIEKPVNKPTEKHFKQPTDKPVNKPIAKRVEKTVEKRTSSPATMMPDLFQQQSEYTQLNEYTAFPKSRKKKKIPLLVIVLTAAGVLGTAICLLLVAWLGSVLLNAKKNIASSNTVATDNAKVTHPPLSNPQKIPGTDTKFYQVHFMSDTKQWMDARIYVPEGTHSPGSLGCVFTAPAGTPLLHGVDIGREDNMEEVLPYLRAGFVVMVYSVDGRMSDALTPDMGAIYMNQIKSSFDLFTKAEAGVLNGKAAIDFVLARIPEVDPKRLISSGHSSAATLSLLLAAKDARISKCVAFAPISDLNPRIGEIVQEPSMKKYFPNFSDYLRDGSPITYAGKYSCPLFILHAMDDENEPFASTQRFVSMMDRSRVTFSQPRRGGHYQPMIDVGFREAIEWLKK